MRKQIYEVDWSHNDSGLFYIHPYTIITNGLLTMFLDGNIMVLTSIKEFHFYEK